MMSQNQVVESSDKALPLSCSHTAYHTIISSTTIILMRMGSNSSHPLPHLHWIKGIEACTTHGKMFLCETNCSPGLLVRAYC